MNITHPEAVPSHVISANKFLIVVLWALFLFSLGLASWHDTWTLALLVGSALALLPTILILQAPGKLFTRITAGAALMMFCGLNIQQAHGMVELHFGIFVLLALLLCYEDWIVIAAAAVVIAVHHLGFSYLQQAGVGVYVMPKPGLGMVLLHAAYVVAESVALCWLAITLKGKTSSTASSRAELQEHVRTMNAVAVEARQSVSTIVAASRELATTSKGIADGAHEQANSLGRASASLEQIAAAVQNSANNAKEADRLAGTSGGSARQGGQVVTQAVTAMGEINIASKMIGEIISTINEIAFQTNLLAVNAAVEAARAGEEGRGFAVVAAEVRSLAQRTADASKEIKRLIEDTLGKVERGAALVNQSGQTLESIVGSVDRVARMVGDIATASEEQSAGIGELNAALSKMDKVTQTNAAETGQMAIMAQSFSEQSARLTKLMESLTAEGGASPGELRRPEKPSRSNGQRPRPLTRSAETRRELGRPARILVSTRGDADGENFEEF